MAPYYVCLGITVLVGIARIIEWRRYGALDEAVGPLAFIWGAAAVAVLVLSIGFGVATEYRRSAQAQPEEPCAAERARSDVAADIFFSAAQERIPHEKFRGIIEPDELLDLAKDYAEYEYIAARDAQRAYEECLMRAGR